MSHNRHSGRGTPTTAPATEVTEASEDCAGKPQTPGEQRIFLNCLRFLANDLHLPLVCAGTNEAKQALMTDQQLADRFEARELGRLA
jgi:hypothetical protein